MNKTPEKNKQQYNNNKSARTNGGFTVWSLNDSRLLVAGETPSVSILVSCSRRVETRSNLL